VRVAFGEEMVVESKRKRVDIGRLLLVVRAWNTGGMDVVRWINPERGGRMSDGCSKDGVGD
jgi:hypothetical protein